MAAVERCPTCGEALRAPGTAAHSVHGAEQSADDRDRTAETRDRAAERRDRGADDRDLLARQEREITVDRHQEASDQDQTASGSDQRTADADQRIADREFIAGGDPAKYNRGVFARELSRHERGSATASRDAATAAREQEHNADTERDDLPRSAGDDRADAADDREESAHDREAALRNRTESAAAAQRALETLEAMSEGFFTLDPEGRLTYLNAASEALLGLRRDDVIGKVAWEAFPGLVADSRAGDEYRRALHEQAAMHFEETYGPLGQTFEARAYPSTEGMAVYFTDVTEQRAREGRLRHAQRLESIGRVTASVAHDFNNLLTAIGGFASLGQHIAVDGPTKDCFDQVASASERAVALTRQLLVFSREQELDPTVIDLNDVITGLAPVLEQLMPAGVELCLALPSWPVPVFVDQSQLEHVVLNLVVNSRDAIDALGTVTITTMTDEPAGHVGDRVASGWLQVADTGVGIAEDVLPLIFDPFFSTKPRETGAGLGLATIYGIVSQSGGTIVVDSTLSVGTTMTVALPAERSN